MCDSLPQELSPSRLTDLLNEVSEGTPGALDQLLDVVMVDLRRSANSQLSGHTNRAHTRPTELINEAYLKLFGHESPPTWESRAHFFGSASRAMRQILVDRARRRLRNPAISLDGGDEPSSSETGGDLAQMVALHEALETLGAMHPRRLRIVELKFFGGRTIEEIASMLGLGTATVERDWAAARAWLRKELDV